MCSKYMLMLLCEQNDVVEDQKRRSNDETMNSAVTALQKRLMVRYVCLRMQL